VQSDGVWPILRASRERALQRLGGISVRVYDKHVALCAMQPGQHDEISADLQIAKCFAKRPAAGARARPRAGLARARARFRQSGM
jgi:hypothetical protein